MSKVDNFNKQYSLDLTSANDLLNKNPPVSDEYSKLTLVEKHKLKTKPSKGNKVRFAYWIEKDLKKYLEAKEIELNHRTLAQTVSTFIKRGIKDYKDPDKAYNRSYTMFCSALFTMLDIAMACNANKLVISAMKKIINNSEEIFNQAYNNEYA